MNKHVVTKVETAPPHPGNNDFLITIRFSLANPEIMMNQTQATGLTEAV
jgi:hypothetical protein